jgi:hypothetical protein
MIIVSETDEELLSNESDKQHFRSQRRKHSNYNPKILTLSQFSKIMNSKKIYSDELEMNSFESNKI